MKKMIKNQKGVTILEVVIAVAILVALSIPIARAIITASKYQYKSRVRENLNIVAESLMENFKAFSLEEMENRFSKEVYSDWLYGCKVNPDTSFSVSTDANKEKTFTAKNLEIDTNKYEITAKVTPMSGYNNLTLTYFDDFDKVTSAVLENKEKLGEAEQTVREDFEKNHADNFLKLYKSLEKMNDTTNLSINNIDYSHIRLYERYINVYLTKADENYLCFYNTTYKYRMEEYPYNDIKLNNETNQKEYEEKTFDYEYITFTTDSISFYKQPVSGKNSLERVYMYYYPIYNAGSSSKTVLDAIRVDNSILKSKPIELYILKQLSDEISIDTFEETYVPQYEARGNWVHLYHNFNRNIKKNVEKRQFGTGEDISKALKSEHNEILYTVEIEVKKDDTVWSKLSSTLKK